MVGKRNTERQTGMIGRMSTDRQTIPKSAFSPRHLTSQVKNTTFQPLLVKLIYSSLANAEKAGFFKTSLPVFRQIDRQINNTGRNTDRQDKKKEHRLKESVPMKG